jgi:preprotein translocase subunit SecD
VGKERATDEGSARIVLEPSSDGSPVDIDYIVSVIRKRLDELGAKDAEVTSNGNRITVTLPSGRVDLAVVKQPGRLEFFDLQGDLVPGVSIDADGYPVALKEPPKVRPNTIVISCGPPAPYCPGTVEKPKVPYYYLFRDEPKLTGEDLDAKSIRQDFETTAGQPVVVMQFTPMGTKKFEQATLKLAERGRVIANRQGLTDATENDVANQQFAIVVDREIKTAPTIDFDDNPSGIPGDNGMQIVGLSLTEAKDLALVLRTGVLPVELRVVSKEMTQK